MDIGMKLTRCARGRIGLILALLAAWGMTTLVAAQGVLSVTPGRTLTTIMGNGSVAYTGDGGSGGAATLARPMGMAYDAAGDLFLADANNHVVREISIAGVVTTVAGTGVAGFGGDGGPATAAILDTPTSVAVSAQGNIYVADSHNHRIREISNGTIVTVAGTGTAGFAGDGALATTAQLALPSAVAVDAAGNLYIADTNNQRVRKVSGTTIRTVAGNGEEMFAGDGGSATAASLDQPTGVAIDALGTLYIADKNDHRVRMVDSSGLISTLAGSGNTGLAGSFDGDGGSAAAAGLAKPFGLSVDAAGSVFVADSNNHRVRQISMGGTINTAAGTGEQGFGGDGEPAAQGLLDSPRAISVDGAAGLSIADTNNQRLRAASLGRLAFVSPAVGIPTSKQSVTLRNTGNSALTIGKVGLSGPFAIVSSGSCPVTPISLAVGASCTEDVVFLPTAAGSAGGAITFSGTAVNAEAVSLSGTTSAQGLTNVSLREDKTTILSGESVTFTAVVSVPGGSGTVARGTATFFAGGRVLGSMSLSPSSTAIFSTTQLGGGPQTITASYSGNTDLAPSTSASITEYVADYSVSAGASQPFTVVPGRTIAIPTSVFASSADAITAKLSLSATDVPSNLTVQFSPASMTLSSGQLAFSMNVMAGPTGLAETKWTSKRGVDGIALALMIVPAFGWRRRQMLRRMHSSVGLFGLLIAGCFLTCITGCGGATGYFGQQQKTYNITVNAIATDSTGGTLTRSTKVSVTVQ